MKSIFGVVGLIAALILTAADFYTSYIGAGAVIQFDGGILAYMPFVFASLTLAFNAASAYLFITVRDLGYTETSRLYVLGLWVFFLLFDAISSWVGFMLPMAGGSSAGVWDAFVNLSILQKLFAILIPTLMVTGPFLATLFWEMCTEVRSHISQMSNYE